MEGSANYRLRLRQAVELDQADEVQLPHGNEEDDEAQLPRGG